MFTHNFSSDLIQIMDLITRKVNFAFARYADGEYAIMSNKKITGLDGWTVTDADATFGKDLYEALHHKEENYYYGIPCPCCDKNLSDKFKDILKDRLDKVTFSNLFVNSNWKLASNFFLTERDRILILNENSKTSLGPFIPGPSNVLEAYRDLSVYYWKEKFEKLARENTNKLFLIGLGPMSELIIHWMFNVNRNNQYVDIGSCLDVFTQGRVSRQYQIDGSDDSKKFCRFE